MKNELIRVEHLEYLNAVKKNTPAFLETLKMVEVENRQYKVYSSKTVLLKGNYLEMVNAARKKAGMEPQSTVAGLPWGSWEIINALISHKGVKYLRYYKYEGELQEKSICVFNEDDTAISKGSELYDKVMAEYNKDRQPEGKVNVCFNVKVDRIVELTTLDAEGECEHDIIGYKLPDEPDFGKEEFNPESIG